MMPTTRAFEGFLISPAFVHTGHTILGYSILSICLTHCSWGVISTQGFPPRNPILCGSNPPGQSWFCHSTQQVLTKIKQYDLGSRDSLVTTQKPKKLLKCPALTTLGWQCSSARPLLNEEAHGPSLGSWEETGKGPFWRELHVLEV